MTGGGRRGLFWWIAGACLLLAGAWAVVALPLTTRQGLDYRVTAYRIPAYVKAIDFLQRHFMYQQVVSRICAGTQSEIDCVLAIFDWTHQTIRPTPEGWTVVDDHVSHIIIRRYGTHDQIADVFVTLAGYAGVPAFFQWIERPPHGVLVLAFARLEGGWVLFDVARHVVFRRRDGRLAHVEDLLAEPRLIDEQTRGLTIDGAPFSSVLVRDTLRPLHVPSTFRAEMQQPWPRLRYELRRVVR